tara:strand:- start:2 stop:688 length:687 start_codon:yes stop_codon:yes gene_type:complete
MANQTGGFGLRSTAMLGSTPAPQGLSEYPIKSAPGVGIYQNDPVGKQGTGGDNGYLQDLTASTMDDGVAGGTSWANNTSTIQAASGVFNGCFYIDSTTSKPTWANFVAASQAFGTDYNTGSSDGIGFVNDATFQEYVVKADASAAVAVMLGTLTYNMNNGATGTSGTDEYKGQSIVKLDIGSSAAAGSAQAMFNLIRVANDPLNKDNTATNANFIVKFAPGSIQSLSY